MFLCRAQLTFAFEDLKLLAPSPTRHQVWQGCLDNALESACVRSRQVLRTNRKVSVSVVVLFSNDDREPAKTIGPPQGYALSTDTGRSRKCAKEDAREDISYVEIPHLNRVASRMQMKLRERGQTPYVSKDDRPRPRVCAVHGRRQKQTTCRRRCERGHNMSRAVC